MSNRLNFISTKCSFHQQTSSTKLKTVVRTYHRGLNGPIINFGCFFFEFRQPIILIPAKKLSPTKLFVIESFFGPIQVSGRLSTYPSPKLTLTLTSHLGQNVGLVEGLGGQFPRNLNSSHFFVVHNMGSVPPQAPHPLRGP